MNEICFLPCFPFSPSSIFLTRLTSFIFVKCKKRKINKWDNEWTKHRWDNQWANKRMSNLRKQIKRKEKLVDSTANPPYLPRRSSENTTWCNFWCKISNSHSYNLWGLQQQSHLEICMLPCLKKAVYKDNYSISRSIQVVIIMWNI